MVLMEVSLDKIQDTFDDRDHLITQSIFMRFGDIGICVIFDDCCHTLAMIKDIIGTPEKIGPLQCLQVLTDMQAAAIHLKNRPVFGTEFNTFNGEFTLRTDIPERPGVMKFNPQIRGNLMEYNFAQHLPDDETQLQKIRSGFATAIKFRNDTDPSSSDIA